MPSTVEITGRGASPGIAIGPLVQLDLPLEIKRQTGSAREEDEALRAAVESAIAELSTLMEVLDEEAIGIVAFQVAMLEDDELSTPAFRSIADGKSADIAWRRALESQIEDYQSAEDEYFRARAADLKDLRDRVLNALYGHSSDKVESGAVFAGTDMTPTRFLETDWQSGGGIILAEGSTASHVAMLARSRGVPMVVGLDQTSFAEHHDAAVDGATGKVVLSPDPKLRDQFVSMADAWRVEAEKAAKFAARPAVTRDGVPVNVLINVTGADELETIDVATCDGIGLMRTEFLFHDGQEAPDEDAQYAIYRRMMEWAQGRPVTIRTLDMGGDKPVSGITVDGEANTFLGTRGIRLSFLSEDVFRVQLRALARAAAHGPLKVMWPMVTLPDELDRAAAIFDEELAALQSRGIKAARPQLGMMVEVPAPAIAPDLFVAADFYSIGSNDLSQYVAAAARDNGALADLVDGVAPIVLRLTEDLAKFCNQQGKDLSLCGDMASDPKAMSALLKAGLNNLSVAPAAVGRVKAAIADLELGKSDGQD